MTVGQLIATKIGKLGENITDRAVRSLEGRRRYAATDGSSKPYAVIGRLSAVAYLQAHSPQAQR